MKEMNEKGKWSFVWDSMEITHTLYSVPEH